MGANQIFARSFLAKANNTLFESRPLKGTAMKLIFHYFIAVGFNRRAGHKRGRL